MTSVREYVIGQLARYRLVPVSTSSSQLADKFSELSGDDVELDETMEGLIVLQRFDHLSKKEMLRLAHKHLLERNSNN
ncbi:hypothetical protein [Vibrio barjaei]|uniref:hypothetical protein n=1 Tax=Vibrio barjaei TaxID=1676683 RepID=UPI002283DD62|nr:hypothetical protein [Vibrio barjaei]MCY9874794.1 hypothetical protein [Vibrio barjaei]